MRLTFTRYKNRDILTTKKSGKTHQKKEVGVYQKSVRTWSVMRRLKRSSGRRLETTRKRHGREDEPWERTLELYGTGRVLRPKQRS